MLHINSACYSGGNYCGLSNSWSRKSLIIPTLSFNIHFHTFHNDQRFHFSPRFSLSNSLVSLPIVWSCGRITHIIKLCRCSQLFPKGQLNKIFQFSLIKLINVPVVVSRFVRHGSLSSYWSYRGDAQRYDNINFPIADLSPKSLRGITEENGHFLLTVLTDTIFWL